MTANALAGMKEFFLKNGFQDYLSKPVNPQALDEVLKKWIPLTHNSDTEQIIAREIQTKRLNKLNHFRAGFENVSEIDSGYYSNFIKLIDAYITDPAYAQLPENLRVQAALLKEAAQEKDLQKIREVLPAFYELLKNQMTDNKAADNSEQLTKLYKEWEI